MEKIGIPLGMHRSVENVSSLATHPLGMRPIQQMIRTHSYGMRVTHVETFSTERYSLTGINIKSIPLRMQRSPFFKGLIEKAKIIILIEIKETKQWKVLVIRKKKTTLYFLR